MPWIPIAMAAGSALMGAQKAKQEREAQRSNMMANAEQMRYSPWSGMSASFMPGQALESPLGAAIGGGMQGAVQGMQFGKQFGKSTPDVDTKEPMTMDYNAGSPFGGSSYAQQLGQFNKPNFFKP